MQLQTREYLEPKWWWPLATGIAFGIVLRVIYSGRPGEAYDAMMGSFALLVPIAVAAVTVFIAELRQRRDWPYYFWMGALANLLFVLGTFLIHIEGLICVILAAPLFAIVGGVAGLIVGAVARWTQWIRQTVFCCALLPMLLGSYEQYLPLPRDVHTLERSIDVAATRGEVWEQLMSAPAIQPSEVGDALMYRIGVPMPESALAGLTPDNYLVRHIRMGKGIEFDQVAADWDACHHVRWLYHFSKNSFPPRALDDHVKIGGEHFDLIDTEYSLQPRPDGRTTLRVSISYRVSTRFNWYAQPVAELFVSNFEESALRFYAHRAEMRGRHP